MMNSFSVNSGWIKHKEEQRKEIEECTVEYLKNNKINKIENGSSADFQNPAYKFSKEKIREFHSRIVSNPKPIVF